MNIEKLKECVEQFVAQNEMFLIEVKCNESNVLSVTLDSLSGVPIDKCIELNKLIESQFDRDIEDYELTVASASISEPFRHINQFHKNSGYEVEVQFMNGTKQIGVMDNVTEDGFTLSYSQKVVEEGKKRKIMKDFSDVITYADANKVTLVIKF